MGEQEKKASGRPRSDQAHQAILQATMEVLKRDGYRAMTIEAIAACAGVGKKTIYRWWSSKAEVALETLTTYVEMHVPFQDTGSLEGDLLTHLKLALPGLAGPSGALLRGLVAESLLNEDFAHDFQRLFIIPRRAELVALLKRGIQRGELPPEVDPDVLADQVYGAKWYRFLLYPAPLDDSYARTLVNHILCLNKRDH